MAKSRTVVPVRPSASSFALCLLAVALSCGSTPPTEPATPAAPGNGSEPAAEPAAPTGIKKRLQGTWEIARYRSDRPIPKEALPIMGELFDSLRMRFDGSKLVVR